MGRLKLIEAHTFGYKILRTQKCAYMSDWPQQNGATKWAIGCFLDQKDS
jgi:hypothetical protein